MARNNIIANVSPLWARNDSVLVETKLPLLSDEQRQWHFAFGTMAQHGIRLAFGSDWPVSSPDPLWAIHTAVNRTAPPYDPHGQDDLAQYEPLLPAEALSPEQALRAATLDAARANHTDHLTGSITVGKSADLVVLDGDPLAVEPAGLGSIAVEATFVAGEPVYRR
jgi:predicted amidohydrolase YtcJ